MTTHPTTEPLQVKPCPFCKAHAVETASDHRIYHRQGCFLKVATIITGENLHQWNTRATPPESDEELDRVALWSSINDYAQSCGGDPSRRVYGNTHRQNAVAAIERIIRAAMHSTESKGA